MGNQIRTWSLPLAVLVYALLALAVSPDVYSKMVQSYFSQAVILPILLCAFLPMVAIVVRPRAPLSLVREVVGNGTPRMLFTTVVFCFGISAFTTFKLHIPHFVPFYADAFFADLDAWLHFGNPGEHVHAILPAWAEYPLAYLYGPVWFGLWFGLLAFVSLQGNAKLRQRYFWSMALAVSLLGTVAATALSSVGPIFYADFVEPDRFADLVATIKQSAFGDYMTQASGYLLAGYHSGAGDLGTGISAMPSMHLAIVTLNALMLSSLNRYVGILAWVYVGLIQIGSVYLGWHYAIDGYFSIAAVSLIWWAVGKIAARSSVRAPRDATTMPGGFEPIRTPAE